MTESFTLLVAALALGSGLFVAGAGHAVFLPQTRRGRSLAFGAGAAAYFGAVVALRVPEADQVLRLLRRALPGG